MELVWSLGISGSFDLKGIQASLLYTNGHLIGETEPSLFFPYPAVFREKLKALKNSLERKDFSPIHSEQIDILQKEMTNWSLQISKVAVERSKNIPAIIGFNGQFISRSFKNNNTFLHLGLVDVLSSKLKRPIVYDFDNMDIENGGHGMFMEATYYQGIIRRAIDRGLFRNSSRVAIVSVEDTACITIIGKCDDPLTFEAGPGLKLVDELTQRIFQKIDEDGQIANRGDINNLLLNQWLQKEKEERSPSSLCQIEKFMSYVEYCINQLIPLDGIATLVAFTAQMIENSLQKYSGIDTIFLVGRGAKNIFLKTLLSRTFRVLSAKDILWNYQFLESEHCAYNAVRCLYSLPISFPTTTGVSTPLSSGSIKSLEDSCVSCVSQAA